MFSEMSEILTFNFILFVTDSIIFELNICLKYSTEAARMILWTLIILLSSHSISKSVYKFSSRNSHKFEVNEDKNPLFTVFDGNVKLHILKVKTLKVHLIKH